MFSKDFYPTPEELIHNMLSPYDFSNKIVLEPSAGKGDIVNYLLLHGASVIACENNEDLQKIVATKCKIIEPDFLNLTSDKISHIHYIVMNPPFSADEKHILHAWDIAPSGCTIISLCNSESVRNRYSRRIHARLNELISQYGSIRELGDVFKDSERKTNVEVSLITVTKPGANYENEFEGFFMGEDAPEIQNSGLVKYNVARDIVNRYIEAIKIFDAQLDSAVRLNYMLAPFGPKYDNKLGFQVTQADKPVSRNDFKKELQKEAWGYIFQEMNMYRYTTKGLREDINRFVEQQKEIPFTMRNIYRMIDIVIQTTSQRMDKALVEVFEKLTQHYHENRYFVEGWKTNSHYLINIKFIMPWITGIGYFNGKMDVRYGGNYEIIDDMQKALCFLTATQHYMSLQEFVRENQCEWGKWYVWGFFEIRGYKKGTMHFKFKDSKVWEQFNRRIAHIKGYPLYEGTKQEKPEKSEKSSLLLT